MKTFNKKCILVIVLISSILNIVGCSQVKKDIKSDTTNSKAVTLKMVWWGNDNRKKLTEQVIKIFEQKNPNVKIEIENFSSTGNLRSNLAMKTADEKMPDIIQMNYDFIHNFSTKDLLEVLDPYVKQNTINLSDVDKSCMEAGKREGKLYGIPMGINASAVAVNATVFQRAGVQIPTSNYTYDDLYILLKTLKTQINEPDFYPLASFFDFSNFVRGTGNTYFSPQSAGLGFQDDKVYEDYFNIQKKWLAEGLIAPESVTKGRTDKNALIVIGKAALVPAQSNQVAPLGNNGKYLLKMISLPVSVKSKEASFIKPAMFLSVSAYSKYKKEAVDFINFITNDLEVNNILMGERGVPISTKVKDTVMQKLTEADKQQYIFMEYMKKNPSVIDPPSPQFISGVNSLFTLLSAQVMSGKVKPEDASKQFRTNATKILIGIKGE